MANAKGPDRDTIIIPQCNTMSTDPMVGDPDKPFYASRIGMDCTIPMVGNWDRHNFDGSAAVDLGEPPANLKVMTEDALAAEIASFIKQAPRSWKEILQKFYGQPYATIYRAFSGLRHKLGRAGDSAWFRYTFSDHDFAYEPEPPAKQANFDSRHR